MAVILRSLHIQCNLKIQGQIELSAGKSLCRRYTITWELCYGYGQTLQGIHVMVLTQNHTLATTSASFRSYLKSMYCDWLLVIHSSSAQFVSNPTRFWVIISCLTVLVWGALAQWLERPTDN